MWPTYKLPYPVPLNKLTAVVKVKCRSDITWQSPNPVCNTSKIMNSSYISIWCCMNLLLIGHWLKSAEVNLRGPFHERFCHRPSNSMEIPFRPLLCCSKVIAMKFRTCCAMLSWHVKTFVGIWYPAMELHWNQIFTEFELRWKNSDFMGPRIGFLFENILIQIQYIPNLLKEPSWIYVSTG